MNNRYIRKQTLWAIVLGFVIISVVTVIIRPSRASFQKNENQNAVERNGAIALPLATNSPKIRIELQPDSPLIVSVSTTNALDPYAPDFSFRVVNRSTKDITAYAVRYETISETSKSGGMNLNNLSLTNQSLQPNSSRSETVDGISFSDPIKEVILSIDFVEFDNGNIWGIDVFRSAERLAGQRTGLRNVADLLLRKLNEGGPLAVVDSNESSEADISLPPGQSSAWLDGFRSGKSIMRDRIRRASKQGDMRLVETELRQFFAKPLSR